MSPDEVWAVIGWTSVGVTSLVGVLFAMPPILDRRSLARFRRLRYWALGAVPLPDPTDERWTRDRHVHSFALGRFSVAKEDVSIWFAGRQLGTWGHYVDAVRAHVEKREEEALAKRAQAEIEEAGS